MVFCRNCGTENADGSSFCRQCGHRLDKIRHDGEEVSYIDVLKEFLYIKDGPTERISKAKLVGLVVLAIYILSGMNMARDFNGIFPFSITVFITYIVGLFYYFLIRGLGYILREYVIN